MKISFSQIIFCGKPENYGVVDNYLSRSAQPKAEDLSWLKEQGVTDIINFRTMVVPAEGENEQKIAESLGINYHNIPSNTRHPSETNIKTFLNIVESIVKKRGKVHLHCKAGADRTGMYVFIYKMLKGIGTLEENKAEWLNFGHHKNLYPELVGWTEDFVKKLIKK